MLLLWMAVMIGVVSLFRVNFGAFRQRERERERESRHRSLTNVAFFDVSLLSTIVVVIRKYIHSGQTSNHTQHWPEQCSGFEYFSSLIQCTVFRVMWRDD